MEADRCSSGVEAKRIPTEKIVIFACDTTDVAEGREVNIKGGRSKSPTSAEFRAAIKEKNKMEVEIGEYQKTLDEMSAAMANLHQEDYGSTIRIQELERRCEIASKQSGHLVSHHQHHMAEAWRKFEEEAQQMRKMEMNAYQYGEKKDMESNVIMQQMRQAEGTIMEQKREIAVMKSYMASEKSAAQESAIHASQIHREASQQISVYQQQIRGIESSTSIEKFNEEEMVQSLKSQLEHALVKRPETYSMEDSREQLMARLNDVTVFAEQESKRADCLLREKEEIVKQYESDVFIKMTANANVVNTNEFFCVPVGKSRQAAIFLGNLVKNAIEEGKRIPKRMEMGSDLGMCIKWVEDIGVPAIYAYSAYYSAKCRGMMKGEGQSMRVALEFISKVFGQLSADECMLGWREFCSKGKKIVAALNQLCGEASLLAKNPELLNVTKYCIEGADMLRSITDIWDLASGVAEDNEERSFKAAFHQDTQVGEVYKEFISDEPTRALLLRRWRSSEEFQTTAGFERQSENIEVQRSKLGESIHVERDQGPQA